MLSVGAHCPKPLRARRLPAGGLWEALAGTCLLTQDCVSQAPVTLQAEEGPCGVTQQAAWAQAVPAPSHPAWVQVPSA